jgi:DNA-binding MarR family transcriptional regulator
MGKGSGKIMQDSQEINEQLVDSDAASQALFRFGRIFGKFPLRQQLSEGRHGVELSHVLVVEAVEAGQHADREVTIGSVANYLEIDPSTASRLVAMTLRAGYLARTKSLVDARAVQLELTPAGVQLAADARHYQREIFEQATGDWSDDEREIFARLFIKFVNAVVDLRVAQEME